MNNNVLLRVENLCQYFGDNKAVDNVSFDIMKGEVFGLVGESGCGKTTTGRAIIKLYDATSGNVYFKGQRIVAGTKSYKDAIREAREKFKAESVSLKKAGKLDELEQKKKELDAFIAERKADIKSANFDHKKCDKLYSEKIIAELNSKFLEDCEKATSEEAKKALKAKYNENLRLAKHERLITKIQMIFQDPIASIDPRMTVNEIIAEGLIIKGIKDKEYIRERVYQALEQVGLVREHATRYPHEFSGGQRQRIGVARSVIVNPDLIIADEPVSALDVSIQAQVINLLNDLRHELNLTILFIAHDLSVVKYFSDRIGVMYYGHLVELATSEELFAHPLHPYTKSLLSAIPLPDPHYESKRKRMVYNPLADHDYSVDKPKMVEVEPGHFVMCNGEEYKRYMQELNGERS